VGGGGCVGNPRLLKNREKCGGQEKTEPGGTDDWFKRGTEIIKRVRL